MRPLRAHQDCAGLHLESPRSWDISQALLLVRLTEGWGENHQLIE